MKNYIYLFVAVIAMASCQKTEIDGEKFSKRKVEKYLLTKSWEVTDFENPNGFANVANSFLFGEIGNEKEKVKISGVGPLSADSNNLFCLLEYSESTHDCHFDGSYQIEKSDPSRIYIESSNGDRKHIFQIVKLEKDYAEIKRIEIGAGYKDELYKLKILF